MHRAILALASVILATSIFASPAAAAPSAPLAVAPSIEVRSDDWFPLPAEEMKRAAGDAAFDRLTDAGRLRLAPGTKSGRIALEIALVGPAETVGLTITLDVGDRATLVSTATISVRGLDHAGIYGAFQHVGTEAADRLVAKLDLLGDAPAGLGRPGAYPPLGDPERRARFDGAQQAKRSARYAESRLGFEAVVTSAPAGGDALARMATDELRYGLPVYEARQALNALGRGPIGGAIGSEATSAAIDRAEHLYRQIRAENPDDMARVVEADRAIDEIGVVRTALANAFRAQAMSRIAPMRMMITQFVMMEGRCPDADQAREITRADAAGVDLRLAERGANDGEDARVYQLTVPGTGAAIELACDRDGVRLR